MTTKPRIVGEPLPCPVCKGLIGFFSDEIKPTAILLDLDGFTWMMQQGHALRDENARLRKALEPFARHAENVIRVLGEEELPVAIVNSRDVAISYVTREQWKAAISALEAGDGEPR